LEGAVADITFKIIKHIAVLSTAAKGWTNEVNLVEWNGRAAKIDIRFWSPDHKEMRKGVTLTEDEAKSLIKALTEHFLYMKEGQNAFL
jgi:hypothetical protein